MNICSYRLILAAVLGISFFSMAPVSAGDTTISIEFAGTGIDTVIGRVDDDFAISVDYARGKGTFGNSTIAITAEFAPMYSDCADDFPVPSDQFDKFTLVYSAAVITFPDLSQLFGVANPMFGAPNQGWLCLNSDSGAYFGQVDGLYVGGTGRFEGASGTFSSPFDGQFLDPPVGFRSITGSVQGTVSRR